MQGAALASADAASNSPQYDGVSDAAIHQNLQRLLQPNMSYVFGFRNRLDGVEPVPVERAVAARTVYGEVSNGKCDQVPLGGDAEPGQGSQARILSGAPSSNFTDHIPESLQAKKSILN
jgi:hypothetical protein